MVVLEKVTRTYGNHHEVVAARDIDLEIRPGDFISVMGPSGCGKTTLLNLIGCLLRPSSGEVWFKGQPASTMTDRELTRVRSEEIGFIFQGSHLIPTLSVLENILAPALFHRGLSSRERAGKSQKALELMAELDLADRAGHLPHQLSLGQRRRVAIARALINGPAIILADEPTNDLDQPRAAQIAEILSGFNQNGLTIFLVTHHPDLAARAGRQYRMVNGSLRPVEST